MTKFYEFQEGDIASFGGVEGVVSYTGRKDEYKIKVNGEEFTSCGMLFRTHTEPLLKLVKKAKSKKTFWLWVSLKSGFVLERSYDDEGNNLCKAKADLSDCIKLEWSAQEFEVEN